ncbi:endo-1,4-beta-xylanase [Marinagarivorans cellulosilyticus]|uniref:Endo-1,4-beta-xylanase n=2 Tax=Marinagarivorans cellulosilyticus TaxID=2721545 RepID=A0AAN1WEA0_9GAMM|nr:endo-1,4-beta-xylanase [Marinagarivorans cellulosilyticus]
MVLVKILKFGTWLMVGSLCVYLAGCNRDKAFSWINPPSQMIEGLQHHVVYSQYEKTEMGLSILVPAEYQNTPNKRYSVVYYLHGWGGNESSEINDIQKFIQRIPKHNNGMPIIVYPNGGRSGYFGSTENRIIKELIPYIDNNFKTMASREGRHLLGFSMGGTAALRLALKYPDLFTSAASLGGRLWQGDESLTEAIDVNQHKVKAFKTRLLFVQGEQDGPDQFHAVTRKLSDLEIPFKAQILPNTSHNLTSYLEQSVLFYTF